MEEIISNNNIPMRIRDIDLAPLMEAYRSGEFDLTNKKKIVSEFKAGEEVRIREGVFSGFNATVLAVMPDKERAEVLLSFFRRTSRIALDFVQLEKR